MFPGAFKFNMYLEMGATFGQLLLSSPSLKSKVPKSRQKGLGLTLKSHGKLMVKLHMCQLSNAVKGPFLNS